MRTTRTSPRRARPAGRGRSPGGYRWPDDFRDEVLARLLDLNQKRAELERLSGAAAAETKATKARKAPKKRANPEQPGLF